MLSVNNFQKKMFQKEPVTVYKRSKSLNEYIGSNKIGKKNFKNAP